MAGLTDRKKGSKKQSIWSQNFGFANDNDNTSNTSEPVKIKEQKAEKAEIKPEKKVEKKSEKKVEKTVETTAIEAVSVKNVEPGNGRVVVISSCSQAQPRIAPKEKLTYVNTQKVIKAGKPSLAAAGVIGVGALALIGLILKNSD